MSDIVDKVRELSRIKADIAKLNDRRKELEAYFLERGGDDVVDKAGCVPAAQQGDFVQKLDPDHLDHIFCIPWIVCDLIDFPIHQPLVAAK